MKRAEILDKARQCVCGDREDDYGTPERNFSTIAGLWNTYLSAAIDKQVFLTGTDVAAMMALLKIARVASGHGKADNWVDLAGYAACGGELDEPAMKQPKKEDDKAWTVPYPLVSVTVPDVRLDATDAAKPI